MDSNLPVPLLPVNDGIFFGLDVVLVKSGVACVQLRQGEQPRLTYATVDTGKLRGGARLSLLRDLLTAELGLLLRELPDLTPQLAIIESGAYSASGRVFQLGGASAIAQLVMMDLEIPYLEATPQQLKKFATRRQDADKDLVRDAIVERWGITDEISHDEADAAVAATLAYATCTRAVQSRSEAKLVKTLLTTYSPEALAVL